MGGKEQTKLFLTAEECAGSIAAVGHSLGGAKASLLAACVNSNNGWLAEQIFSSSREEQITGECARVCHHDQYGGLCKKTHTNPLRRKAGTYKVIRRVSDSGCCSFGWSGCIKCCKVEEYSDTSSWRELQLFTFAAPAITTSQLMNGRRHDKCFRGVRYFNYDDRNHFDLVTTIATASFRHPNVKAVELSSKGSDVWKKEFPCASGETGGAPSTWLGALYRMTTDSFTYGGATVYRLAWTLAKYHRMREYIDRVRRALFPGGHSGVKASTACYEVCHHDQCLGTWTNPIPKGLSFRKNISRISESGCCLAGMDACDWCCSG